jgi:preprotein translocase subunit SecD
MPRYGMTALVTLGVIAVIFVSFIGLREVLKTPNTSDLLLTLEVKAEKPAAALMDAIKKRAVIMGAGTDDVVEIGPKLVSVRLPGFDQDHLQEAVKFIEKRGLLEFKLVDEKADPAAAAKGEIPTRDEVLYLKVRNPGTDQVHSKLYVVEKKALMKGDMVTDAQARIGNDRRILIDVIFNDVGAREFERITGEHVNKALAIILDDRLYSAPVIRQRITGGHAVIEGAFDVKEAWDLAVILRCGALAAPVEVVKTEWVKPIPAPDRILRLIKRSIS